VRYCFVGRRPLQTKNIARNSDLPQRGVPDFDRDPIGHLDAVFPAAGDAFWLPAGQLCVAEPVAAKAVLANDGQLFEEHSDFFHTRKGYFGPRGVQVAMGRASRQLLNSEIVRRRSQLAATVEEVLGPESDWPDAGNWLVYRHLGAAVAAPDSPPQLFALLDQIVARGVVAGARGRHSRLSRAWFRRRALKGLEAALRERRRRGAAELPADLLDVLVGCAPEEVPPRDLAELFLPYLFAIAGSVGFALGWCLYLIGTHPEEEAQPAWVVREALRLWPIAWLLGRRPARATVVAGIAVSPRDEVIVCPYLVHRHPRYWDDPTAFRPGRWATEGDREAFIPFGWGSHTCAAASTTLHLVEDILTVLGEHYRLTVTPHSTRPSIGAALAAPRFSLGLRRSASIAR